MPRARPTNYFIEFANIVCLLALAVGVTLLLSIVLLSPDVLASLGWWIALTGAIAAFGWSRLVISRPTGKVATISSTVLLTSALVIVAVWGYYHAQVTADVILGFIVCSAVVILMSRTLTRRRRRTKNQPRQVTDTRSRGSDEPPSQSSGSD